MIVANTVGSIAILFLAIIDQQQQVCSDPYDKQQYSKSDYQPTQQEAFDDLSCSLYNPCDINAICGHHGGSYTCDCKEGYKGDGKHVCSDINECLDEDRCHYDANCTNSPPGSFTCECVPPYEGDGLFCSVPLESTFAIFLTLIIVFVVLIGLAIFCCVRKRCKSKRGAGEKKAAESSADAEAPTNGVRLSQRAPMPLPRRVSGEEEMYQEVEYSTDGYVCPTDTTGSGSGTPRPLPSTYTVPGGEDPAEGAAVYEDLQSNIYLRVEERKYSSRKLPAGATRAGKDTPDEVQQAGCGAVPGTSSETGEGATDVAAEIVEDAPQKDKRGTGEQQESADLYLDMSGAGIAQIL